MGFSLDFFFFFFFFFFFLIFDMLTYIILDHFGSSGLIMYKFKVLFDTLKIILSIFPEVLSGLILHTRI